jgi:hypothetical protein
MMDNANPHADLDDFDPSLVGYECDGSFLAEVHAMEECGEQAPQWHCQLKPDCGAKRRRDCPAIKLRAAILATAPILTTWKRQ